MNENRKYALENLTETLVKVKELHAYFQGISTMMNLADGPRLLFEQKLDELQGCTGGIQKGLWGLEDEIKDE